MPDGIAGVTERNQVEGTVSAVLFRNEENGYREISIFKNGVTL